MLRLESMGTGLERVIDDETIADRFHFLASVAINSTSGAKFAKD